MNEDSPMFLVTVATMTFIVGIVLGWCLSSVSWRQELVSKGFEEWQIVAGTREVEFKWKENK